MFKLSRLLIVGFLLALFFFCVQSTPARAHVNTVTSHAHSVGITTYLKRGQWGNYYFSPTYITCRIYTPCFTIINATGRTVMILDQNNSIVSNLWNGRSTGEIFIYYPGIYWYTDVQANIRVPLNVYAHG